MSWLRNNWLVLALSLLCSCSSSPRMLTQSSQTHPPEATAATGHITASYIGNSLRVKLISDADTVSCRTAIPEGMPQGSLFMHSGSDCLALAEARDGVLEFAAAATSTSLPRSLELELMDTSGETRQVSQAATDNSVTDLLVLHAADNLLRLTWTMTHLGDYDFNGEVAVSDLIPLARSLGDRASEGHPWDRLDPQYYVDGDGNNEVNIADITVIARNLGTSIGSYGIIADGELLQLAPLSDAIFTQGNGLPPRFSVLVSSESVNAIDSLAVVPLDQDGNEVAPPSKSLSTAELSVLNSFEDMQLLHVCSVDGEGEHPESHLQGAECHSILRIIDPIDDVGNWEPPSGFIPEFGTTLFNNLKRGKLCYIETRFLPQFDPATDEPNLEDGPNSEGLQRISYPIRLPQGTGSYEANIQIRSVDYPGDGVYLDIFASSTIPGSIPTVPLRLHPALDRVSRDLDFDGDYDDEAWLHDANHDSLSDSLEEYLRTDDKYFTQPGVQLTGIVQDILPERGELKIANAIMYEAGGEEQQVGDVTVHYTEFTGFETTNPQNQSLDPQKVRPSDLSPGLPLLVDCEAMRLTEFDEVIYYWAQRVSQSAQFDESNRIHIIPALTERRPGQVVNVTVYANDTVEAFNSLELMTLHIRGAGEVVEGSLNPGVQGGADDEADGIWQLLGPEPVDLDANVFGMGFLFGKYYQNFDVSIRPGSSLNLSNASGALFNFDLRIYEPVVVLAGYRFKESISRYADAQGNSYDWTSQPDEDSLYIDIKAPQPYVVLVDGSTAGDGSYFDPYIIEPGVSYSLQVIDELDGDITGNPNIWYVVDPVEAGAITYNNPVIELPEGFEGFATVHVLYPGKLEIPGAFAKKIYFHTP